MQPNNNRPVYIFQPSNITHLNVRPTIITTGGQQIQTQQPNYQISTVRQPTIPQQSSTLYQVQSQPRLVTSSPVYTTVQPQRFSTSPQQIVTTNTNLSPRPLVPQSTLRMPISTPQTSTTIIRPGLTTIPTSPTPTTTTTAAAAAPGSKEFSVKVPKTQNQYGIMEFATGLSIDVKDWKSIEMRREINPYTYRPATNLDPNASSTATTITTSLGTVLPKTGLGSEYGREQKEALKRKRYATKGTNMEDLPWLLTDRSSTEKKYKYYRGIKKGGITSSSSYYVFIQGKDGFEAYPVDDWFSFTPTNVYKVLEFEEAEKKYRERNKYISKWFLKNPLTTETENDDEKEKKSTTKTKRDFKLLDADDWINENEEEEEEEDEDRDDLDEKSDKKSKTNKKNNKKPKEGWALSDDDDEEITQTKVKKRKTTQRQTSDAQGEDSDDGDHDCDEIDYTSDETSEEEDDIKDVGTVKSSVKYEVKGVDEELKTVPDIDKKLKQMDENDGELDFDDDEEDIPDIDDPEEENEKTTTDDLSDVGKLLKNDAVSKEIESSSDDDDLDDSDDPDKESVEPISMINTQPNPSEQITTGKGHRKAREDEMRAIKSKVMSLPTTPSNPTETITEEKVRNLLSRKPMTLSELIQSFLPKNEHLRTKEMKEGIVQKLATILKSLNVEDKTINGKKCLKLKTNQ